MREILQTMTEIAAAPLRYARRLQSETGKRSVGYVCSYTPEEIIVAAGANPLRLFGVTGELTRVDAHLQSYCCSLVRCILESGLKGDTDCLAGVVFPHTCDSMQRLSDLWRLNVTTGFHLDAVLPVKLTTESAREYYFDVLRRFREDMERESGVEITPGDLWKAYELMGQVRSLLFRIYALRCAEPKLLSGDDLLTIVKASMIMDRRQAAAMLGEIAAALSRETQEVTAFPGTGKDRKRLLMVGGVCNHPRLHGLIEAAGGVVVWDDLCTGARYFQDTADKTQGDTRETAAREGEPLRVIAESYLQRAVCPAKHAGLTSRAERIVSLVRDKGARGVIFLHLKFCDPHAFDYPYLKTALDREKIPHLMLEIEDPLPAEGQLRTRLEAFMEMI
ncbi:MAG TPA: 2-hydroxyacyl-CoA dehydratase family protein [Syntrophales bacterium]|nr:2-hydroxyacyl-CoA dehydratase family protein [Syntrophales bacterium]